jgi:hypothetical protein
MVFTNVTFGTAPVGVTGERTRLSNLSKPASGPGVGRILKLPSPFASSNIFTIIHKCCTNLRMGYTEQQTMLFWLRHRYVVLSVLVTVLRTDHSHLKDIQTQFAVAERLWGLLTA